MEAKRWAAAIGVLLFLSSGVVFAQPVDDATRGAARALGYDGVKAYQAGDYVVASEKLDKAYRVLKVPSLGLWSARALVQLRKLVEATERYTEVQRLRATSGDEAVQKKAQAEAEVELAALAPRIPHLVVELDGAVPAETAVSVDGVALNVALIGERRPTNPGQHLVVGVRGPDEVRAEVDLAEGERKVVRLVFIPSGAGKTIPASPARPRDDNDSDPASFRRLLGWVSIGVGSAGVAVGATFGMLAMSKRSELDDSGQCRDRVCSKVVSDDVSALSTRRTISSIGFIAGGTLVAAGITLVLTAPHADGPPTTSLRVNLHSVALRTVF
jgi:hypothetical protein